MLSLLVLLSSCADGMPQLLWSTDDKTPDYARDSSSGSAKRSPQARQHLEVPPELRAKIELPMSGQVATQKDQGLPDKYQKAVAGKAVSLHARVYPIAAAKVFSATVDAMTSLNLPVDSVDSPSGIVTTDWVRRGSNSASLFGFSMGDLPTRHRFIVRVYRVTAEKSEATKLEIRVLGQVFKNSHWVNQPFKRSLDDELFQRVEEMLGLEAAEKVDQKQAEMVPESE